MEKVTINKCCAICNNCGKNECPFKVNSESHIQLFKISCSNFVIHNDLKDECEPENIEITPKEPLTLPGTSPWPSTPWPESPYPYPNPIIYPQVWYSTNAWPLTTWPKPEEPNTVSVTGTTNDIVYTSKINEK